MARTRACGVTALGAHSGRAAGGVVYWRDGDARETSLVSPYAGLAGLRLAGGDGLPVLIGTLAVVLVQRGKGYTVLISVAGVGVVLLAMLLWFVVALVFRRRFQFGIRALLVLTVAVAMPCSWLGVEMKKASEQKEAAEAIEKVGATVTWDPKSVGPECLQSLLQEDLFAQVEEVFWVGRNCTDTDLTRLKDLRYLRRLDISQNRITDAGLANLEGLGELQELGISYTDVTDEGLRHLKALKKLQLLGIGKTAVTDAGLEHLRDLRHLEKLWLFRTKVNGTGFAHLKDRCELRELNLRHTEITDAGVVD